MKRKTVVTFGGTFIQVTLLFILFVLEYLSGYKAGLAQHLYFKKVYYLSHYYQGVPLVLNIFVLLALTIAAVVICSGNGPKTVLKLSKYFILFAGLIICFCTEFTRGLNVYAHVLMTLQFCLLLEVVSIILRVCKRT